MTPKVWTECVKIVTLVTLIKVTTVAEAQQQCNFQQTCDQSITGRNMPFSRALEIVQTEEYLSEADLDFLRRRVDLLSRQKRGLLQYAGVSTELCAFCTYFDSLTTVETNNLITNNCLALLSGVDCSVCCPAACTIVNVITGQVVAFSTASPQFECIAYETSTITALCSGNYCGTTTPSTTTTESFMDQILKQVPVAVAVGTSVAAVGVVTAPQLPLTGAQGVPPGNPPPGTPGGGAPPTAGTPAALAAVALVPAGLVPIAVFPPFATPRTVPATAVIFAEANTAKRKRRKRSIERLIKHYYNNLLRIFDKEGSINRRNGDYYTNQEHYYYESESLLERALDSVVMKFRTFKRNLQCFQPRLMAIGQRWRQRWDDYLLQQEYQQLGYNDGRRKRRQLVDSVEENEINSLDDCVEDVEEPLFGFRVQVTLAENEPCTLNDTCRLANNQEDVLSGQDLLLPRQTGEAFSSDSPPDCRVGVSNCFG